MHTLEEAKELFKGVKPAEEAGGFEGFCAEVERGGRSK